MRGFYADTGQEWVKLGVGSGGTPPDPDPPTPETRPYPLVASWDWDEGPYVSESGLQTFNRLLGYGFNGWVAYSGSSIGWSGQMASVASGRANYPVNLQVSPKAVVASDIRAICNNLPVAWRPGFRWAYYQEPEDNHTTPAQIADYKAKVSQAATIFREYSWASAPWLELAEYWASTNPAHTAEFIPDNPNDYGGVLWSFFEYGENISMPRLQSKVNTVANFMSTYAPGKPWEIMASCYTMKNPPFNAQQRNNQATWLSESFHRLRAAGCTGWAWYNVNFIGGNASGEGRVEENPAATQALQTIANAGYTVPIIGD